MLTYRALNSMAPSYIGSLLEAEYSTVVLCCAEDTLHLVVPYDLNLLHMGTMLSQWYHQPFENAYRPH